MNASKMDFPVGVEIETPSSEYFPRNVLPITFSQGIDTSCGFEFRSTKMEEYQTLFEDLPNACAAIRKFTPPVNDKCGLHVHIGFKHVGDLSAKYRLFRLASCYEDLLFRLMPPWAERAKYCTKLPVAAWDGAQNGKGFNYFEKGDRRFWLNGKAMFTHGTVEFRHMNGTTDDDEILGWVSVLQCMFHSTTNLMTKLDWKASQNVTPTTLIRDIRAEDNKIFGDLATKFILRKAEGL